MSKVLSYRLRRRCHLSPSHKCCQVSDVFTELCIASRTKSKCDALAAKLARHDQDQNHHRAGRRRQRAAARATSSTATSLTWS